VATVVRRLHPLDLAAIGLQNAWFLIGVEVCLATASGTTGRLPGRLSLGDPLLEHGGSQQIAGLDTLVFQLGKGHRPSVWMKASSDNFFGFGGDFLQSFPLNH
jgi:hypothetical protein